MGVTADEALARTLLLTRIHRLPDADDRAIVPALTGTTVAVVADEANLQTAGAQAAVTTLAGLVAACGMGIKLVMPPVAMVGHQPPVVGEDLIAGLSDLAADSVPGASAEAAPATGPADIVFVIGDSPWSGDAARAWRLGAEPWVGHLLPVREPTGRIATDFPIGPLAAATAAAAEAYRAALSAVVTDTGCSVPEPAFLRPAAAATIRLAADGTPTSPDRLDRLDMVSGGALTTAALHGLLRVAGLRARVRIWEPQDLDPTNLNRYVLMRRSMLPMPKIAMLQRWQHEGVSIEGFLVRLDEDRIHSVLPWAPWVMVGTDNVETRWLVQRTWPEHLVVAGTAGFMALVSEHDQGRACVGCLHPISEDVAGEVPTVSFVSYLGGLMAAARLLRWATAAGPAAGQQQATEAWADRLDSQTGFRLHPVQRMAACPVGCSSAAQAVPQP